MATQGPEGAKVEAFVPRFPAALADCRSFSPDELRRRFAFLQRMLESGLPYELRASHRLQRAERLLLPFGRDAHLWRFLFEPVQPAEKVGDTSKPAELLAFEVAGELLPVDFTDACFAAAMAANPVVPRLDSEDLKQAYLAVYFAVSRRAREQDSFYPSFRSLACPEGIDAERWATAQSDAGVFAAALGKGDLYVRISRRDGEVVAFDHGYHAPSRRFGSFVPIERQQRVVLADPGLIDDEASTLWAWGAAPDPLLGLRSDGRRRQRQKEAEIAIRKYRSWRPAGLAADAAPGLSEVTAKAGELHAERRRRFPWVQLFPAAEPEETTRQARLREIEALFAAIDDRLADYSVPSADATDPLLLWRMDRMEMTVQRRALPFYPGHRLYKILDRRGGRPRLTQILFAAPEATIPEGLDRLIPLNDLSLIFHMLNAAYRPHLQGLEAVEYLDFFCDAIGGPDGAFHVIETAEDVRWRGQVPAQREIVEQIVTPIRLWSAVDADPLVMDAIVTYAGALFHAEFKVSARGMVEMTDDTPLYQRLEIAPELFSARTHFFLRPPRGFIAPPEWRSRALAE